MLLCQNGIKKQEGVMMDKLFVHNEVRMQYMLPWRLHEELQKQSLVFLPVGPLEWHGPHLAFGTDPLNAEQTAVAVARQTGGVVHPTLFLGTERERPPEMLESLGFNKDEYVVGMDFPEAKGLFRSFYFSEELFAMVVRAHIQQFIEHGYKYIFIVNGHGAVNHNEVLNRLCKEFTSSFKDVAVAFSIAFPEDARRSGICSHAGKDETSLMMHFDRELVDLAQLPPKPEKLKYKDYSIVDDGGFSGNPGKDFSITPESDPRSASIEFGEQIFQATVEELTKKVKSIFQI
jgi:creatinine amidohydrolase